MPDWSIRIVPVNPSDPAGPAAFAPQDGGPGQPLEAWDGDTVWSVDTNKRVIYQLNPRSGEILNAVGCSGPEPHGMTIWQGQFWLCDAETRQVYTLPVPQ